MTTRTTSGHLNIIYLRDSPIHASVENAKTAGAPVDVVGRASDRHVAKRGRTSPRYTSTSAAKKKS
jgi:hypothetical protein